MAGLQPLSTYEKSVAACLWCVWVHEITRPWLWQSALSWADSCPTSRWISNERNLTAVLAHARQGWEEELVNGGRGNAWLGQSKTEKDNSFQKKNSVNWCRRSDREERGAVENLQWQQEWTDKRQRQARDGLKDKERERQQNKSAEGPLHCNVGSSDPTVQRYWPMYNLLVPRYVRRVVRVWSSVWMSICVHVGQREKQKEGMGEGACVVNLVCV